MAKKIKFPLEMRDGVQARTLEELQEYFDIEKAMSYLVDGKLCTWLEDRYYMSEAETIKGIDAYASDAKEKLCSALGVELEVDAEVDVEEIERRKERLAKLKQYTDDELIWEKVDQVAFNQEDLADLLDEDCKEIYLCGNNMTIPLMVHNVKYIGVKKWNVVLNGEGGNQYCREHQIILENLKYESSGLEEGEEKYMNYELQEALELLIPEAESGMGRAMWILYMIYTDGGCGLETDVQKAREWCLRGEQTGDPLATLYRALFYYESEEEKKEICREVKPKVKQMADAGDALAQNVLGISYINETDEPMDYRLAVEYLQRSSDAGYWRANNSLGLRYENGQGVEQNALKALEYYKKSADAGYVHAQYNLGRMYEYGQGIETDIKKAEEYYQKAYEQYSQSMKKQWRDELIQKLNNFSQYTCRDMLYKAEEATGCNYYNFGLNGTYSSESACRSAGENKIDYCIRWLQNSWSLSDSSNENYKRLGDVREIYDQRIGGIVDSIYAICPKISGKTWRSVYESLDAEDRQKIDNYKFIVSDSIKEVVRNGDYVSYYSYEAVDSIECLDMEVNESYLFRQAKYRIMGWKDRSIKEQEKQKCQDFSEALFQRLKEECIDPLRRLVERIN